MKTMSIADRLDEAMRAAGFPSQMDLSRASGVPQPTINRILKLPSKKGPETETLIKLASACNVSFEWLREGKEPRSRIAQRPTAGGSTQDEAALIVSVGSEPEQFKRHWLSAEEADHLANFRSLTSKNRKRLRTIVSGMERDGIEDESADKL